MSALIFLFLNNAFAKSTSVANEDNVRVLENLRLLYADDIKEKFGRDLQFSFVIETKPTDLNGSFPGKELRVKRRRKKLNHVIVTIIAGSDINKYSPIHMLQVACHELGHGLAKGRKKNWFYISEKKIATEGESDYFASKCMLKYFSIYGIDDTLANSLKAIDADVLATCTNSKRQQECIMILQASKDVLEAFDSSRVSYIDQSDEKATETNPAHPSLQCRLDTIKASFLEKKRPRCWHNPLIPVLHKDLSMMF